ncbi:hypothetical protein ACFWRZ_08870 [Streptomyces rubiginosohelvolus]|uniref:hypothetical protein n=1 Tax=Streptomyces rubiginosohelvolus TaxID=67362 RepID=UPI00364CEAD8
MPRVQHQPAPALAALLLDQMHAYRQWDLPPALYVVYNDHFGEIPLSPIARDSHPRLMVKAMADAFERASAAGQTPPRPPNMVGIAMMFEFWAFASNDPAETAEWRKKNFADHPRAYESRLLIAEQPGHPPVVARHNKDTKRTGEDIGFLTPGIVPEVMVPGTASPAILHNVNRVMRAMMAPPSTFRK